MRLIYFSSEIQKKNKSVKFPMSNTEFLKNHSEYLVEYEQKEILKYGTIHYVNIIDRKKKGGLPQQKGETNHGWSTQDGYSFI